MFPSKLFSSPKFNFAVIKIKQISKTNMRNMLSFLFIRPVEKAISSLNYNDCINFEKNVLIYY